MPTIDSNNVITWSGLSSGDPVVLGLGPEQRLGLRGTMYPKLIPGLRGEMLTDVACGMSHVSCLCERHIRRILNVVRRRLVSRGASCLWNGANVEALTACVKEKGVERYSGLAFWSSAILRHDVRSRRFRLKTSNMFIGISCL